MHTLFLLLVHILCVFTYAHGQNVLTQVPQPPSAKKIPVVFEEFGNKRIDNYYWMNNRDSQVIQHLRSENEYAKSMLQHTVKLQEKLFEEIKNRQTLNFSSLPFKSNGHWYYERHEETKTYPVYYRRKENMNAAEEIIQDVNVLAAGYKTFIFQRPVISPDNKMALFSMNTKGDNRFYVKVKDLIGDKFLTDSIVDKGFNFPVWARDNKSFYYVKLDTAIMRPYQVLIHELGTLQNQDKLIYHERDSNYYVYIFPSSDRRYLFINSSTPTSKEISYLRLDDPSEELKLIVQRKENTMYGIIGNLGDDFYLYTNHSAPDFKIAKTKSGITDPNQWKVVIPERKNVYLEPTNAIVKNKLITKQRVNGIAKINVLDLSNGKDYFIPLDQDIGYANISFSDEPLNADSIRVSFTSYAVPYIDYKFDLNSREKTFIRQTQVKYFSSSNYITNVIMVPVRDGTLVPVSMVYNKTKYKQDGKHHMFLNTYSWYNFANDPYFQSDLISLLDRGFIYVYPHARGGAEKGPPWWNDGRRMKRMNTFYDVVDCAQYLVDKKYTGTTKLIASGTSAGGTNIGAMVNLRPDLFKAVIAEVPWLDVVTDMKNINVPTVTAEYEEEGNPWIEKEYHYMTKWSPYDNVQKAKYPKVLATASWYDNNVPFYHAAKWVAKLREHNTGAEPVLLISNLDAGHSGSSNKFERMKNTARKYAFILDAVGIKK
ncbi:MAG: prolyl oligopeptidase family serine peptidase [Bacteroidota bacterium]|nr:prolyl oligopeptidase family serine peptidase [Bacteroidota bacterium]